ncbi:hypothetical protein BDN72DRAFT_851613 [Pluteus cervinus]|uniref:Uncharacterized protein n=1 Tax=Pluteus cervinus TaxID=181527 RepID=A0ACD2ZZ64_9AGAR|nr:hypothetical protein BDN72DRAFT_851613 [Pluteus cervinus]
MEDCPLLKKEIEVSFEMIGDYNQPLMCKLCNRKLIGRSEMHVHLRGNCKGIWGLSPDGRKQKRT